MKHRHSALLRNVVQCRCTYGETYETPDFIEDSCWTKWELLTDIDSLLRQLQPDLEYELEQVDLENYFAKDSL